MIGKSALVVGKTAAADVQDALTGVMVLSKGGVCPRGVRPSSLVRTLLAPAAYRLGRARAYSGHLLRQQKYRSPAYNPRLRKKLRSSAQGMNCLQELSKWSKCMSR